MQIEKMERGITKLGLLITIGIIVLVGNLGLKVANFYYSYYELEGLMEFQARKSKVFSDNEMKRTIFTRVWEVGVPLDGPDDIHINRVGNKTIIETSYNEVLDIEIAGKSYDLHVFPFHLRVEATQE